MLTKQEWWGNMTEYNSIIWPGQYIMLVIAAIIVLFVLIKPSKISSILMKLYMVISFGWIGIGLSGIGGNYAGTILFSTIALFFSIDIYKQRLQFVLPKNNSQRILSLTLLLVIFSYPLLGLALGHNSSEIFMIGTYPCPTTSLALVMMTFALPQINKILYVLLLFWAIMSIPAILVYSIFEDTILLINGIFGLVMFVRNWKSTK